MVATSYGGLGYFNDECDVRDGDDNHDSILSPEEDNNN